MSNDVAEDDTAWMEACRREEAIRELLRRYPDRLTVRAVEDVASELGLSRATPKFLSQATPPGVYRAD
jgi:putative transposase